MHMQHTSTARAAAGMASLIGAVGLTAAAGARTTRRHGNLTVWYNTLQKPPFQPPKWLFGPVWTLLYALMAASAYRIFRAPDSPQRTTALALWGGQLALNAAWTELFFGRHDARAALVDSVALVGGVGAYIYAAQKVDKLAAGLVTPYLAWVSFAALLNEEIVRLNRKGHPQLAI